MQKGTLHLIPNILAEHSAHVLPTYLKELLSNLRVFYVEEIKSARRLLKMMNRDIQIDQLTFHLLNEHENNSLQLAAGILSQGTDIAYLSEAGCPAIADPGQELVAIAHAHGCRVKPHVGPNSILLALMASGFNGQQFRFHGYLPNKQPMLSQKIKEIELESRLTNCTQLFIETPYRNHQLMTELIKNASAQTRVCVAIGLTGEQERIISQPLREWARTELDFHKIPAVFVLYAGE